MTSIIKLTTIFFLVILVVSPTAHAYLDPGSGSYLFQILLAGILGGIISLKMFWQNIKSFITKLFSKKTKSEKKEKK